MEEPPNTQPDSAPHGQGLAFLTYVSGLGSALALATVYEFMLVGLDTYGYSLSRRSSYMIFFNAFLAIALAIFLNRVFRRTIRQARILRPEGWMSVCLTGGLLVLYWAWAVDRWLRWGLMGSGGVSFSLSPAALGSYVAKFHEKGLWGWGIAWYYDHAAVRGTSLTLWWILEACSILLLPSALVWRFLTIHPQCVRCGSWMTLNRGVRRLQSSKADRLDGTLRNGDFSVLEEPDRPQKGDPFTVRIDLSKCEFCPDAFYMCLVRDREVLLWMHPIPAGQVQKVYKPVRASSGNVHRQGGESKQRDRAGGGT